jgi:hypothetical protein
VDRLIEVMGLEAILRSAGEFDLTKDSLSRFRDRDGLCSLLCPGPGLEPRCSAIVCLYYALLCFLIQGGVFAWPEISCMLSDNN